MKTVSVAEMKAHLSRYLHMVRRGASVIVTSHRHPVARLEAVGEKRTAVRPLPPHRPVSTLNALRPVQLARPTDAVSRLLEDRERR